MRSRTLTSVFLAALVLTALAAPAARAEFGIKSFDWGFFQQGGGVNLQAGAHPYELKVHVQMNVAAEESPEGTLSQLVVQLPAGVVGDPLAVPPCPAADFEGQISACPGNSQVGVIRIIQKGHEIVGPVFNLTPPPGVPASLGFSAASFNSFQEVSVRTGSDYGVTASDITIPTQLEISELTETIWGVPADPSHDSERVCVPTNGGLSIHGCENEVTPAAFLTLPSACAGPLAMSVTVASVEEPLFPRSASALAPGEGGMPEGVHGCDGPPFAPTIEASPETTAADSPTGLHVDVHLPQSSDPGTLATADLKDSSVTLPSGLAVNPSSADGLGACTPAQIDLHGPGPAQCPANSQLGTVVIHTPLLAHPVPGKVYLASQGDNPFGSLIALYIVADDPITGVIVKLAGKVIPDPVTGQLTATFDENPQLPFEDLEVDFSGGPRASLTTPPTCGIYTTQSTMVPWSTPEGAAAHPSSPFHITSAAGGGPCAASEAQLPNAPSFEAGTTVPLAGAYSPFVLRLTREDGTQQLRGLNLNLPLGMAAKFAGRAECSDAQIAQAEARDNPGEGALERQSPSCPSGSELGTVTVGAGSGSPFYVTGHAYLAGPYKGAPFSIVAITPAVAGSFDLGVVVVRSALYVNEETAQGTVKTDPIPTILQGIPLQVRSIAIKVDNGSFVLNPTSCEAKAVTGEAISPTGSVAKLSNRFQVGGCSGLAFKPKLQLSLKGSTKHTGHPALKAVVTYPQGGGYANIARAQVNLPKSEFIDQGNLNKTCTRPVLLAGNCPASTVYGKAKAWTPLLEKPLAGNVYLVGGYGYKLPALVAELNGQIRFLLIGKVDSGSNGGIRNTFETVPDAPVEKFVLEMKGGKKYSLLENSEDLCAKPQEALARFTAQNGKVVQLKPKISNNCAGASKH